MKKIILFILIVILFPQAFVAAEEFVQDFGQDEIREALPETAQEYMENIKPLELTFSAVVSEIWELLKKEVTKPLKMLVSLTGVIILCAAAETLRASGEKAGSNSHAFEIAGVLAGAGIMSASIAESVTRTSQTLTAAAAFMLTFIPILAGIMAVMGQVVSAGLFNTSVLLAAQLFSQVMVTALMPLSASILGVSIAGAVSPDLKTENLAKTVKTVVIWVLGFLATVFTGLLTVQSLVSGNTDTVTMKAVKFTVSGGVPIIGGAVSDALGVVNGSVAVLKSSTGAFGIISIVAVCLPSIISVVCFRIALSLAGAVSDMFGSARLSSLLKSGESVLSVILAMSVCFMLIMLVSVALMIKIGSGGGL
ncbi:MAG: stage III sporulation protein AE [Oscillospiraceae bacterium]|nr:stage III sporulation protein AE [Oscillospiraceae bacterium]